MYEAADFIPNPINMGVQPTEDNLHIAISIQNITESKKIDFHSWRGTATLIDDKGNSYKTILFPMEPEYLPKGGSIFPNQYQRDILVFEKPMPGIKYLRLRLSESAIGELGYIQLELKPDFYSSAF
jgi:hypothetical protein